MTTLTVSLETLLSHHRPGQTLQEVLVEMLSQEAERLGQVHRNEKSLYYFDGVEVIPSVTIQAALVRRESDHGHR